MKQGRGPFRETIPGTMLEGFLDRWVGLQLSIIRKQGVAERDKARSRLDLGSCTRGVREILCAAASPSLMENLPRLKAQEIPLDHPDSNNMFQPRPDKPLVATPAAIESYSEAVIFACWQVLREKADENGGLDYLQVFEDESKPENLWFMEDGPGGAITALLPSDH